MDNIEILRAAYEALESSGVEGFLEFVHPEFETTTPPSMAAEPDTYGGHDGLRRYFDSFYEVMDEVRFEPLEFVDLGTDQVLVDAVLKARGQATGIEVGQHMFMLWTIRDGEAYRVYVYATEDEARAAAEGAGGG